MAKDRRDIQAALKTKGFTEQTDRDHTFYILENDRRIEPVFTKVSHGSKYKTIGDGLFGRMAKQVKLSKKQFVQFVDCDISGPDYLEILVDKGILS